MPVRLYTTSNTMTRISQVPSQMPCYHSWKAPCTWCKTLRPSIDICTIESLRTSLLADKIQGLSFKHFQRPWIFKTKFKHFHGFFKTAMNPAMLLSNYGPISYRFGNGNFSNKCNFPTPMYLAPPLRFPLVIALGFKKTGMIIISVCWAICCQPVDGSLICFT